MRCLTLTQPWATLVAIGEKRFETRSWATKYRGPLAIHAAKTVPPYARNLAWQEPTFASALGAEALPLGVVLAVAELRGCWPTEAIHITYGLTEQEAAFGDFTPNRYAWRLVNVRRLPKPIPAKGALGLWDWTWAVEHATNWDYVYWLCHSRLAAARVDRWDSCLHAGRWR